MLKYELIPQQLLHEGAMEAHHFVSPPLLADEWVLTTHDADYFFRLKNGQLTYQEERRIGFPYSPALVERELRIAKGTIDGSLFALEHGIAFNVAGGTHHAGSNWGEGFCMLNDQAIAANYLLTNKLANRILIIDLDVHQGNGTAEIFQNEDRVFTFSMHAEHNFPFRKERSDLDIGLADGISDAEYLSILEQNILPLLDDFAPDFVFYLSGVDILATDKLGKLAVSKKGCKERDALVLGACKARKIPLQVSMGGGYSPDIKDIVDAHCNTYKVAAELYS
jgi:acetoin utilization deacetylase AcuC-like enzyme